MALPHAIHFLKYARKLFINPKVYTHVQSKETFFHISDIYKTR